MSLSPGHLLSLGNDGASSHLRAILRIPQRVWKMRLAEWGNINVYPGLACVEFYITSGDGGKSHAIVPQRNNF